MPGNKGSGSHSGPDRGHEKLKRRNDNKAIKYGTCRLCAGTRAWNGKRCTKCRTFNFVTKKVEKCEHCGRLNWQPQGKNCVHCGISDAFKEIKA